MKEEVRKYNPEKEYYLAERCYINELANTEQDAELSIARVRVPAGTTTSWHKLNGITERYVIIEGHATVEIGTVKQQVGPNDVIVIPPGCRQRITNKGEKDLVFLAICSPRFVHEAYQDLENAF